MFGEAVGGHGVPGVGFIPELVVLPLPWLLLPGVVELDVDPGVVLLLVPGSAPHGPPFGCVLFGVVVDGVLPGIVPGLVPFGVVVLFGVVFGVALGGVLGMVLGVVALG